MSKEFYKKNVKEVFEEVKSSEKGISEKEFSKRFQKYGDNMLEVPKNYTIPKLLLNQVKSIMILILFIASLISFFLGEFTDGFAIIFIVIINVLLGFVQEYKAEKTLESLKDLEQSTAIVIRAGAKKSVLTGEMTIGDVVYLEEGMKVPADLRIFESNSLKIDESILTGESNSISKNVSKIVKTVSLGDRKNMAYKSTLVSRGTGLGVVIGIGESTELGKISKLVRETEEPETPLQIKLDSLSKQLALVIVFLSFIIFLIGIGKKIPIDEILIIAISLAVSAIPEGLPAVVTVTLAIGVQKLAKENVLIRKLSAAETLGSTNIILTDKTGTLTENQMNVRVIQTISERIRVTERGGKNGNFFIGSKKIDIKKHKELQELMISGCLNNNSDITEEGNLIGDQTELSLISLARKGNYSKKKLLTEYELIKENPFSSETKRMSKTFKKKNKHYLFVKGAPEAILKNITKISDEGRERNLTPKDKEQILANIDVLTKRALRILLIAKKESTDLKNLEKENKLTYLGVVGIMDLPRKDVSKSISQGRKAGVRTVMLTGDHANTAKAIAREVGIFLGHDEDIITGKEIDEMSEEQLVERSKKVNVFARVSPEHKVKILNAFKMDKEKVVAMTGDGVNDAPALKTADIGISMGKSGTEVAKNASKMILLDDNYSTIISAIKEGRVIYDNLNKFIRFLLSANFAELILVCLAVFLDLPIPFLAVQLLFLNIVTDGFPALALGVDPAEKNIMKRKPRKKKANIVKELSIYALVAAIFSVGVSFYLFNEYLPQGLDLARTVVFTSSVVFELILVFSARSNNYSLTPRRIFENKKLIQAVLLSAFLQFLAIYTSIGQNIFRTIPLDYLTLIYIIGLNLGAVIVIEVIKPFIMGRNH